MIIKTLEELSNFLSFIISATIKPDGGNLVLISEEDRNILTNTMH